MTRIANDGPMNLPRPEANAGEPPTDKPEFVSALAEAWFAKATAAGLDYASAIPELPYRASYASKRCDRQLHYAIAGVPESNPASIADHWRMEIGSMVHAQLADIIPTIHPRSKHEVEVDLRPIGIPGSAHADLVTYDEDGAVDAVVEFKTINGFGWKMAATSFKGPPEGPRSGHVLQAAMVAKALGARRVIVGYLALENLSPSMASSFSNSELARFCGEWHYALADVEAIVEYEVKRVNRLIKLGAAGVLPAREIHDDSIPAGAVFDDPNRGTWRVTIADEVKAMGSFWLCGYCDHRDRCLADGAS